MALKIQKEPLPETDVQQPAEHTAPKIKLQNLDKVQPKPKKTKTHVKSDRLSAEKKKKKDKKHEQDGMKITYIPSPMLTEPENPMTMGTASPELVHKLSWALPGALPKEMIRKMERFGYDYMEAQAPKMSKPPSSFLEGGSTEVAEENLGLFQRPTFATKKELNDAKHAIKMFVIDKARKFGDIQNLKDGAKVMNAAGKLLAKAEAHMLKDGTLVVRD